ncbi:hypothetical protein Q0Z83_054330 [Actinoplanes sichuanensis]|uniref:Uncharacterized protein n=1 Tax=Actinoplanes sichuanensis TaxID=512349 RepID=A0ABW4A9U8_9ACTN|nr:hypothetical protein [Actinoplanes sichuanensis]BEL07242.1 hypothetical protein Q0Z83_054330 [Actinoplanes sichuanensis]
MDTVTTPPGPGEKNPDQGPGVTKAALRTAGGSGVAIIGILTASAFGAIHTSLAMVALAVFGVIMLGALIVAGIYIIRSV